MEIEKIEDLTPEIVPEVVEKTFEKKVKFFSAQKPIIIDEENRIFRIKASTGIVDRDNDTLDVNSWTVSKGNIPFVDSHNTNESVDKKLGEIIKTYVEDGSYWNEIQLDTPPIDKLEWTDGNKLSNRVWGWVKDGKDIKFSVGFFATKPYSKNSYGGKDYKGQEQYEGSAVLVPANEDAGTKSFKDMTVEKLLKLKPELKEMVTKAMSESIIPYTEICLNEQLMELLEEKFNCSKWFLRIFPKHCIFCTYESYYESEYWQIDYSVLETGQVTIGTEKISVESKEIWVTEVEEYEVTKSLKEEFGTTKEITAKLKSLNENKKIEKSLDFSKKEVVKKTFNFKGGNNASKND